MDIEGLTKHQIVLLTLLVSFVTSIATGIVTVALMSQAPPSVTRTINQIVEHTVQTVASSTQGGTVVQTQKTVVVKDDDLVAQSIAALQKSVIRITARGGDDLIARGLIITQHGEALTDRASLENSGSAAFDAILPNGRRVPLAIQDLGGAGALTMVQLQIGTSTTLVPATIADESKLHLGQTVLRLGGTGIDAVSVGVISTIPENTKTIDTNVVSPVPGSVLATLFGEVVGMTTASSLDSGAGTYTLVSLPAGRVATST